MINYKKFTLDNGLRVIVHEDKNSSVAAVNVLYNVGSADENPEKTGFAHLFEHLMFGGSVNIPDYDQPLQRVGGENNAFTNCDITNYYVQVPSSNIETALWLESDRMLGLAFSEESLQVQRMVVCEEFKQRYLNQPYGDAMLKLRSLAYNIHPYQWPTIGKELSHIENADIEDVKSFFNKFYNPCNAVIVISGNINTSKAYSLANKWFGSIPEGQKYIRNLKPEPVQTEARTMEIKNNVPADAIYKAWHISGRIHPDYYTSDLISDILSRGYSSRLYHSLVKEQNLFSSINAYTTGDRDPGLFIIEGKISKDVDINRAEDAIEKEITILKDEGIKRDELIKVKNKIESTMAFSEISILERATNLAYFEVLDDASLYNDEPRKYRDISKEDIEEFTQKLFSRNNSSTLYYRSTKN